ncbi:hypothetical protein [Methylocella sp.]|uniref:hypothetical protein n=1 Tax=Methylocella sp. TaxID=1978226 RepID=UPI0037847875
MIFEKLTWTGFIIVAAGWALLLSTPQLNAAGALRLDFAMVAQCAIISGLGIAVIGALQTGFGALNRFFDAVVARSQQSKAPAAGASIARDRTVERTQPSVDAKLRPPPQRHAAAVAPRATARKILERGWVKDRAYVQFTDGTVEVETLLGRRMFPSLKDAREFIA